MVDNNVGFMKKNVFLFTFSLLFFVHAQASESTSIPNISFEIKSENVFEKIQEVALNPELFLSNYNPAGAKVRGKKVNNAEIQFYATKTVLFITQTVFIKGTVSSEESDNLCSKNEKGYLATMDFSGSDGVIYDNFEKIEVAICATEKSSNLLTASVKGRIFKGNNYNSITGAFVKEMINQQVKPLIEAIKMTVENI